MFTYKIYFWKLNSWRQIKQLSNLNDYICATLSEGRRLFNEKRENFIYNSFICICWLAFPPMWRLTQIWKLMW